MCSRFSDSRENSNEFNHTAHTPTHPDAFESISRKSFSSYTYHLKITHKSTLILYATFRSEYIQNVNERERIAGALDDDDELEEKKQITKQQ